MNWEAIGAVGEIVGALAVVLSLVYLAISFMLDSVEDNVTQGTQGGSL